MQVVAALGLVVLVPCAVALNYLAGSAAAGGLASVWRSPSSWPAP
jgi:hypothetical protein